MLRNIFPRLASQDKGNGCWADAKLPGDTSVRLSCGMERTNLRDVAISQFGEALGLSPITFLPAPALSGPIDGIVLGSSGKQMIGITATSVIASMKNPQPWRDWAVDAFPSDTVTQGCSTIDMDLTVAGAINVAIPNPTIPGFIHLSPDSIDKPWVIWNWDMGA